MSNHLHMCSFPGCESRFSRPSKLEVHFRKHTGERPFVCDEESCGKTYTNQSHLRRHKARTHQKKDKDKTFKCTVPECNQVFTSPDNMKRHVKNVHSKDYFCVICNEGFHKKHKLRAHIATEHATDLTFRCQYCPAEFKSGPEFKKHVANHKSYTCSCGEVFYRWTIYLNHRKTEHKPTYICKICNKKFANKLTHDSHLAVHDTNRPVFQCPFDECGRLYYYKSNLQCHIQTFHFKIKKPIPPSKQKKMKNRSQTLPTERLPKLPRKDKNSLKQSSALKLTGLTVPYEGEKALLQGSQIEAENSDQLVDTSDCSDLEASIQKLLQKSNVVDSDSVRESNK